MKVLNSLLKWLAAIVIALSAGLLVIILISPNLNISAFLLRLIQLAVIGFIGSLTFRLLFNKIPAFFGILFSLVNSLLAVLVIDHFSEPEFPLQILTNQFLFQLPNASDIGQIIFMTLISLFPQLPFRKKAKPVTTLQQVPAQNESRKPLSQIIKPVLEKADPGNWHFIKSIQQNFQKILRKLRNYKFPSQKLKATLAKADPRKWELPNKTPKKSTAKPIPAKKTRVDKPALSVVHTPKVVKSNPVIIAKKTGKPKPAPKKAKLPSKFFKRDHVNVKLVGEEEHVCPYCLDEVYKNDNRGVMICPDCGTWHHQDCWSLTGSCGVAHRNEL